jgi:glycine oxidase
LHGAHGIVLLERGELGKEASWAAGGILAPQVEAHCADEFFELACTSRDMYPAFAGSLKEETGIDVELDQTGTLNVAFDEQEERELRRIFSWQRTHSLRVEWLSSEDVRALEPNLSPEVRCALRFPDDWQVENRKLVQALIKSNEKLGVNLNPNCEVSAVQIEDGRVACVETSRGSISTRTVIVAAGAWSSRIAILREASTAIDVEPVRGQMLCFNPQDTFVRHVIYSSRGYVVPRRDGRLLAGSTSERAGFDKSVTEDGIKSIKSMAFEIAPGLASAPLVDAWAGFRPHAPDDLPVIGADPEVEGLFYATGHYRNGILLAPVTARMIADGIIGGPDSGSLKTFSPNRFQLAAAGP